MGIVDGKKENPYFQGFGIQQDLTETEDHRLTDSEGGRASVYQQIVSDVD